MSEMNETPAATPASSPVDELVQVTELGKKLLAECNKMLGRNEALYTKYMLNCGKVFLRAKELIKDRKSNWGTYVSENIPNCSQATVKHYILLAGISKIENYAIFGKQRLIWLNAVIDKTKEDPIGAFITEHHIQYDPEGNQEPQEFKTAIDVAISMKRLANSKIVNVDVKYIKFLSSIGKPIGNSLVSQLAIIKASGGDVNKHLEALCRNNGEPTSSDAPRVKMVHINELSRRVTAAVKTLGNDALIQHANRDMIQDAVTHLNKVLALMGNRTQ